MHTGKKIVLLTPGFPADEHELANVTYLQDLVLSYRKYYPGAALEIITFQYPFRQGGYKWNGVDVYAADGKNKRFFPRLSAWRRVWKQLKKIESESGILLIHSFWLTECTLLGQRFCERNKIRHIATIMGQDALEENKYLRYIDLDKVELVAISQKLKEQFKRTTNREVKHIIPFGLDPEKFPSAKPERNIDLVGVGSLIPLKRYDMFIDIVAKLAKELPGIRACIIGTGPEKDKLQQQIGRMKLGKQVELKGELSHKEVFDLLCRSRVFLHPSSYEGQSLVMMEALYAGLPVVCFDTGRPYNGERLLVCKDENEMLQGVRKLLNAADDHQPVLVQDVEQTARQYFELYLK